MSQNVQTACRCFLILNLLENNFQLEVKTTHTVKEPFKNKYFNRRERPSAELKTFFATLIGGGKPLSIFKAIHIVKRKSVTLQPCVQKSMAKKT